MIEVEGYDITPQQRQLFRFRRKNQTPDGRLSIYMESAPDGVVLRKSLDRLVARHSVLRTRLEQVANLKYPIQVIDDTFEVPWRKHAAGTDLPRVYEMATADTPFQADLVSFDERRHLLVLTFQAGLMDSSSMNLLIEELAKAYDANGMADDEEEEPIQYVQFAQWLEELIEEAEDGLNFWAKREKNIREPATTDHDAPYRAACYQCLPPFQKTRQELDQAFWLTCWAIVLERSFGGDEVCVATSADGRSFDELHETLGLLARYLPVILPMNGRESFAVHRRQATAILEENIEMQDYFGLDPKAESAWIPFAFNFEKLSSPAGSLGMRLHERVVWDAPCHLRLMVLDGPDEVLIGFEYDASRYDGQTIALFGERLMNLAHGACADEATAIDALPMLTLAERHLLLQDLNQTRQQFPAQPIHRLFEQQAATNPGRVALVSESCAMARLTYGDLEIRANRLAHTLMRHGMGPGRIAALNMSRTAEFVVAMLATLKTGGAYLPLDPRLPDHRRTFILQDTRAIVIIGGQPCEAEIPHIDPNDLFETAEQAPNIDVTPDDLAYTVFTSGSTGEPKGVMITHGNVTNYVHAVSEKLAFEEGMRFAVVSSVAADLGNTSIFPSLCLGGELHLISDERAADAQAFGAYFEEMSIDCLKITPTHLRALMSQSKPERALPHKRLVLGGEATSIDLVGEIAALRPELHIFNHYGPSETTVGVMVAHDTGNRDCGVFPLGPPIANTEIYLLNPCMEPVPLGSPGELYIGGKNLAQGYMKRPGLTAERFVPDPFSGQTGKRLYRTGDLIRYLPEVDRANTSLAFIGRADHQLKIRGFRVEPGEIEAVLERHESVDNAVVLDKDLGMTGHDRILVGYVACKTKLDPQALRDYVATHLPDYMTPGAFVFMDKIPVTSNGKRDRKALLAMDVRRSDPDGGAITTARNAIEEVLVRLWMESLALERVDIHTRFFNLGGHSLLIFILNMKIREIFCIDFPIAALFEAQTVAQMAALIQSKENREGDALKFATRLLHLCNQSLEEREALAAQHGIDTRIPPDTPEGRITNLDIELLHPTESGQQNSGVQIRPRPEGAPSPLSFEQQRLWFLFYLEKGGATYNNPIAIRWEGELDADVAARAFAMIEARHQALRTTFTINEGKPQQIVQPAADHAMEIIDLSTFPVAQREIELKKVLEQEALHPFDLEHGPVWRTGLARMAERDYVVLVTMHHICSDAISLRILSHEFHTIYAAFLVGESPDLLDLPVQYADYAWCQRNWMESADFERQSAFWKDYLDGAPPLIRLRTDRPRTDQRRRLGRNKNLRLPAETATALKQLGETQGATPYMTFLAAFNLILRHNGAGDDIVLGSDSANRNHKEIEPLIGFFINQLVLRTKLDGNPTINEVIARCRDAAIEVYAHQDMPFDQVVKDLNLERNPTYDPVFQVKFFLDHLPAGKEAETEAKLTRMATDSGAARHELTVALLDEGPAGMSGSFNYDIDLFDDATIDAMIEHLRITAEEMVANPEQTLDALTQKLQVHDQTRRQNEKDQLLAKAGKTFRKRSTRRTVRVSGKNLVDMQPMTGAATAPLLLRPAGDMLDIVEWATLNRNDLEQKLHTHGALLFRGFGIDEVAKFDKFAATFITEPFTKNGEHQDVNESGSVQTPVAYASDQMLLWHNENTFNAHLPSKIIFACATPAQKGGETPIVDSRLMYARMDPEIREEFVAKGVLYERNYSDELGLGWRKVFGVETREEVEKMCRDAGFSFEWRDGNRLKTRTVRPAAGKHPISGELCWINQAQHWHFSCLDPQTSAAITKVYSEEDYPRNCYFGDGSRISDAAMAHILELYRELEARSPWEKGDVMVVDNLLCAHGRYPYEGERRLFVCQGDMLTYDQL